MSRTSGLVIACVLGAVGAAVAEIADPGGAWTGLAVLGAALIAGELLELRPGERAPLALSYAIVLVLVRAATPEQLAVVVVAAESVAFLLRSEPSAGQRLRVTAVRVVATAAALLVYRGIIAIGTPSSIDTVLIALSAAGVAAILVDDLATWARTSRSPWTWQGRTADLALVTSGVLMSIAYRGVGDIDGMGLWGPLVFSVPLLAAWYSFERLAAIRRTYEQTISALSVVPELAALTRPGHAERVATLCHDLGADLGLSRAELDSLRAAALLHHLGHLCLDDPVERGRHIEPSEVMDKGAEILRQTGHLAPAGDILATDTPSVAGQILRVASAYDELTAGDPAFASGAVEALFSGPGYVYDARVLDALERVVLGDLGASAARRD